MGANVRRMDYVEHWELFSWLTWVSHFELEWDDMMAMDAIEGR